MWPAPIAPIDHWPDLHQPGRGPLFYYSLLEVSGPIWPAWSAHIWSKETAWAPGRFTEAPGAGGSLARSGTLDPAFPPGRAPAPPEWGRPSEGYRAGRVRAGFDYERFNCNNLTRCYWSWNYRGCWHQTCPPIVTRWEVWLSPMSIARL